MRTLALLILAVVLSGCQSGGLVKFPRSLSPDFPELRDLPNADRDLLLERVQDAKAGEEAYQEAIVAYFEGREDACIANLRTARRHFEAVSTKYFSKRAEVIAGLVGQICQQRADQLVRLGDHLAALGKLDEAELRYRQALQYDGTLERVLTPRVNRIHAARGDDFSAPAGR